MKTLYLYFVLASLSAFSQSDKNEFTTYLEHINTIEDIQNLKNKYFDSVKILILTKEIERNLDFEYVHHRFLILPTSGPELRINCITKDSVIQVAWTSVFRHIGAFHANRALKNYQLFKHSPEFFTNYIMQHNNLYKSNLNKEDFIDQLTEEFVVGYSCGETALFTTPMTKKAQRYTHRRKKRKLRMLLKSFSPELQMLGAIELHKLGNLKAEDLTIIKHLKTRNSIINTCAGDLYGIGENFATVLEKFN